MHNGITVENTPYVGLDNMGIFITSLHNVLQR